MPIKQNTAINPTQDTSLIKLTRTRSPHIKNIEVENRPGIAAGYSNPATGVVHIPDTKNAFGRTVRYHEALHVQHTPAHTKLQDALDQALEDVRLHRYKSLAHTTQFPQARRDEISVALRDLRTVARHETVSALQSVVTIRAMAILLSDRVKEPNHRLLLRVLRKFSSQAYEDFAHAIKMLESSNGTRDETWATARKQVERYFSKDFTPPTPSSSTPFEDDSKEEGEPTTSSDTGEPSKPSDAGEESEEGKEEGSDEEGEESKPAPKPVEVIPAKFKPKTPKPHKDEYTDSLVASFDANNSLIKDSACKWPITVYIRRLDMETNRVKLSFGKRREAPTKRGRKIRGSRLAAASFQPGVRVFERPTTQGQSGTILIDASASMGLTEKALNAFLKDAPARTLAFYNAPDDNHYYGNIYIYAANGFRASGFNRSELESGCINGKRRPCSHYGYGNVIDYQAMVWLSKQPGPRYLLTDCGWTRWKEACRNAVTRFEASKTFTVVRPRKEHRDGAVRIIKPIEVMLGMLDKQRRQRT